MRRTRTLLLLSLVALVAFAACGSDSDDSSSSTTRSTAAAGAGTAEAVVAAGDNATLGAIVVDDQGRTVYTLTDAAGKALPCEGSCLEAWPPVLLVAGTEASGGRDVKGVATVSLPEGEQVTIRGLPIYTFAGDAGPGDANGEGIESFNGVWRVVKVSGAASGTSGTTKTTDSGSGSGTDPSYDYSP
jgi:predicted lipoprotein with Yx(FWY)xxD motif